MRQTLIALATLSVFGAAANAIAADAPASPHTVTGNVSLVSDYRFRGISQTFKAPAIQAGFDYAHASGFYLGNWNSNVSGISYPNGASLEMDLYGGYKTEVGGVGLDVGTLYYYYPSAEYAGTNKKFDNHEVYLGASLGPVSAKVSYALSNYFGLSNESTGLGNRDDDSKGTAYYEVNFSQEVAPKLSLSAHVGTTVYKKAYKDLDYTDYKLGLGYDVSGYVFGVAVVGNTLKEEGKSFNTAVNGNGTSRKLYSTGAVASLTKTF